jgi:hypothetical protein
VSSTLFVVALVLLVLIMRDQRRALAALKSAGKQEVPARTAAQREPGERARRRTRQRPPGPRGRPGDAAASRTSPPWNAAASLPSAAWSA